MLVYLCLYSVSIAVRVAVALLDRPIAVYGAPGYLIFLVYIGWSPTSVASPPELSRLQIVGSFTLIDAIVISTTYIRCIVKIFR